jgi:hypothetical protein
VAGLITAAVGTILSSILLIAGLTWVTDRMHRAESAANLRRIGQAIIDHADNDQGKMVPAFSWDANGRPLLSWRVALLPDLGEKELYKQFHLDEPWDSPHNLPLVGRMPKIYAHPADPSSAAQGLTYYRVFIGQGIPFGEPQPLYPANYANGTSQTILVAEAADPVPWTKPDELIYDSNKPLPKLGGRLRGGFNVVMADGTTRFFRDDLVEDELRWKIGDGKYDPIGGW